MNRNEVAVMLRGYCLFSFDCGRCVCCRGAAEIERLERAAEINRPAPDTVPIPTGADQAELMAKLGLSFLEHHAPDRLTADYVARRKAMETVDSTSDQRTVNNTMRHAYRVLSDAEKAQMQAIKDKGLELHELIQSLGSSRELSLAATKVEESVMWAVKHLTK